jgi:hypothetical protein
MSHMPNSPPKRKSKTTLAEKIAVRVEGDTEFERFSNLIRQIVHPPKRPAATRKKEHEKSKDSSD